MMKIELKTLFSSLWNSYVVTLPAICILFFLINLIVKSYQIQTIPPGAPFDEMYYATQADSIIHYFSDITGRWRPWNLAPANAMYSELTGLVQVPGFLLFPHQPILASKVMPIFLGSLLPVLLALITYRITKSAKVLVATALIATLNPWIFQFSRMGYDSLFSLVLLNLGLVMVLYLQKWKMLLSIFPLFLSFYQYQGHKLVFVPLITLTALYKLLESLPIKRLNSKQLLQPNIFSFVIILGFSIVLMLNYLIRLPQLNSAVRMEEYSLMNQPEIVETVDVNRRLTFSNPLITVMDNKGIQLSKILAKRFFNTFDPVILFIEGNKVVDTFAVNDYGFFHYFDLILFFVGVIFLISQKQIKYGAVYLIGYILIGTIPNIMRNGSSWITFRGAFTFMGLIMLAGIGAGFILEKCHLCRIRILLSGLYIIGTISFFYIYFFRYPLTQTTHRAIYDRILASYIKRQPTTKFVISSDWPEATFHYILAYNQMIDYQNKENIYLASSSTNYYINNLEISGDCPKNLVNVDQDTVLLISSLNKNCVIPKSLVRTEAKSIIDSGTMYQIVNDGLCSQYSLPSYIHVTENMFNIEKLSDEKFCTTFFMKGGN